jgi:hypothetical protein
MTKISNLYTLTNYISANSSGNVVIAAPSSGYALDVTGTGRFTSYLTANGYYVPDTLQQGYTTINGRNGMLVNGTSDYTSLMSGGFETMFLNSAGRVGIGTTAPNLRLSTLGFGSYTSGSVDVAEFVDQIGTSAKRGIILGYVANGTAATAGLIRVPNNGTLSLNPDGGNVGIGTSTPASLLHLKSGNIIISKTGIGSGTEVGNIEFRNDYMGQYPWAQIKGVNGSTHDFSNITFWTTYGFNSMSEKMRITSDGNVGIGTTSVTDRLTIKGTGNYTGISVDTGSATGGAYIAVKQNGVSSGFFGGSGAALGDTSTDLALYAEGSKGIRFYTNATNERMRITSGGNVGIGTTSPSALLHVVGSIYQSDASKSIVSNKWGVYNGGATTMDFDYNSAGAVTWIASGTEKMRLTGAGNLCLNRNAAPAQSYPLVIRAGSGDYIWKLYSPSDVYQGDAYLSNGDGQFHIRNGSADVWLTTSAGGWSNNSDISIKENLVKIEDALAKVNSVNGYTYNIIDDETSQAGLVAQEIELVLPEAVSSHFSKTYERELKGLNYDALVPLLVEAIKELSAKITALESK